MTEAQVLAAACEYLAIKRHCFTRVNNGGVFDVKGGFHRKPSKHTKPGMSDILVVHVGNPYFLECKSSTGTQSPEQKDWQREVEKAGGYYALVRSVEDIIKLGL